MNFYFKDQNQDQIYLEVINNYNLAYWIAADIDLYVDSTNDISAYDYNRLIQQFNYATELFKEIEDFIGKKKDDYKVINLGIHPSIAQYNGFYSIDGYIPNYPLSLHTKFQKINEKEYEKKQFFGEKNITISNGVYLISSELSQDCDEYCFKKVTNKSIKKFEVNINELKKSKVEYIFSSIKIQNTDKIGIEFQEIFEKQKYPYIIYLYKII